MTIKNLLNTVKISAMSLAIFSSPILLSSCDSDTENAAENAGESMNDAAENAGENMNDAAESTGEGINDATESVEDSVEDATDQ